MAGEVLTRENREKLFEKLRYDPTFRERMKENWREAIKSIGIDAEAVVDGVLKREEIEEFANQAKGWSIEITFRGGLLSKDERVEIKEAVVFQGKRK